MVTKICDHCGTPAKRRYAVRLDRAGTIGMVGSSCAKHFPRARIRDLTRSLYAASPERKPKFFHATPTYLGGTVALEPRIPHTSIIDGIPSEDFTTPRVSFSTSMEKARDSGGWEGNDLFVYGTDRLQGMIIPDKCPFELTAKSSSDEFVGEIITQNKYRLSHSAVADGKLTEADKEIIYPILSKKLRNCVYDVKSTGEVWATRKTSADLIGAWIYDDEYKFVNRDECLRTLVSNRE